MTTTESIESNNELLTSASPTTTQINLTVNNVINTTDKKPKVYDNKRFIKSFIKQDHIEPYGYYEKGYYPKNIEIMPNMTQEEFEKSEKNQKHLLF